MLMVTGGSTTRFGADQLAQAAAYDPAMNTWEPISGAPAVNEQELNAGAPVTQRAAAAGLWTGDQVLVVGGMAPGHQAPDASGFRSADPS